VVNRYDETSSGLDHAPQLGEGRVPQFRE
jgi:hypothetical protein